MERLPMIDKRVLFEAVRDRLREGSRPDDLQKFHANWEGTGSGIEGFLKVVLVAAVPPTMAKIKCGGAGGTGRASMTYPDLNLLFTSSQKLAAIELKATGSDWWLGGKDIATKYAGQFLIALCPGKSPLSDKRKRQLEELDPGYLCDSICDVQRPEKNRTFYLVMLDLTG